MSEAWADDFRVMRATAAARLRSESLQRWWCKKYNRPRKDPLLGEYTLEELMIEYLEDRIEEDPSEEFPQDVQESGRYVHATGDELFDQWQVKAASGVEIDFSEAFQDEESKAAFEAAREKSRRRHAAKSSLPEDVHDDYTGGE